MKYLKEDAVGTTTAGISGCNTLDSTLPKAPPLFTKRKRLVDYLKTVLVRRKPT